MANPVQNYNYLGQPSEQYESFNKGVIDAGKAIPVRAYLSVVVPAGTTDYTSYTLKTIDEGKAWIIGTIDAQTSTNGAINDLFVQGVSIMAIDKNTFVSLGVATKFGYPMIATGQITIMAKNDGVS